MDQMARTCAAGNLCKAYAAAGLRVMSFAVRSTAATGRERLTEFCPVTAGLFEVKQRALDCAAEVAVVETVQIIFAFEEMLRLRLLAAADQIF